MRAVQVIAVAVAFGTLLAALALALPNAEEVDCYTLWLPSSSDGVSAPTLVPHRICRDGH